MKNNASVELKNIGLNVTINALSIVFTIIGTLLGVNVLDPNMVKLICIIIIIFGLLVTVIFHFYLILSEIKVTKAECEQMKNNHNAMKSIPLLFLLKKRVDHYTVLKNGDGKLIWELEVEKKTEEPIHFIDLPLMCEHAEGEKISKSSIQIEKLLVDNEDCTRDAKYSPNVLSHSFYQGQDSNIRYAENGSIQVPVKLFDGRMKTKIVITLSLKDMFCQCEEKEFVVIDIPCITEHIEFILTTEYNRINTGKNFLNIYISNSSENEDKDEEAIQNKNCDPYNGEFRWKTTYPKLGYRYKFNFSVK